MNSTKYTVLMSVYISEIASNLTLAIESILNQTIKPFEIILVKDGILTKDLEEVLINYNEKIPNLKIIEIESNVGLGNALNLGLKYCQTDLVMRMDTDDYSINDRAEKLLKEFEYDKELDVVGSSINEFIDDINNIVFSKKVPINDKDIKKTLKYRNPINHPSVMFKKKSVENVSGYIELKYNEDYFLWVRMAIEGYKFKNLKSSLLLMRITEDTYERRRGYDYFKNQKSLFKYMEQHGYISKIEYFYNIFNRLMTKVLIPKSLMRLIYMKILREKKK